MTDKITVVFDYPKGERRTQLSAVPVKGSYVNLPEFSGIVTNVIHDISYERWNDKSTETIHVILGDPLEMNA